jgi:uncharacterized protein with NRDE domain
MCTIAILIDVVDGAALVVAANRDEIYARPARPPEVLMASPRIVGGVDALSGGTWLAVRADGHFAAVTNQRVLARPPPGLRSRGLAVMELAAAIDPDGYVAAIDPAAYASMNLVWRSRGGVAIAYARHEARTLEIERLARGVHVLCNDRLGAEDFPRAAWLARGVEAALDAGVGWPALSVRLAALLGDHHRFELPATAAPTRFPPEVARELTATCIHTPRYGTRSSSIVALAPGRVIDYLHADGPPCTTPFVDRRELVESPRREADRP